jgi:hypothetical protein
VTECGNRISHAWELFGEKLGYGIVQLFDIDVAVRARFFLIRW